MLARRMNAKVLWLTCPLSGDNVSYICAVDERVSNGDFSLGMQDPARLRTLLRDKFHLRDQTNVGG